MITIACSCTVRGVAKGINKMLSCSASVESFNGRYPCKIYHMHFFEMFNIEDSTVLQIFCPVLSDFDKKIQI